jgi:hypothetical protein
MRLFVPILLALAACAAPGAQWEKPGADQAAVAEALQQCRVEARLSPQPNLGSPTPRSGGAAAMDRMEEREAREALALRKCMHDKGYSAKR